jgi:hypothetical protein
MFLPNFLTMLEFILEMFLLRPKEETMMQKYSEVVLFKEFIIHKLKI